ncbi:hypothetical protein NUSPORA_00461 [Nucleospora cyclopteri]
MYFIFKFVMLSLKMLTFSKKLKMKLEHQNYYQKNFYVDRYKINIRIRQVKN